ncbi:MAG TPA: YqaE/Pmp3 family membrane protein, partial [Rubrobacteraceae bacterium]|nr:YqaE/Pmp3 family membrane protein [Rubrobacteraceae bacterium]
SPGLGTFAAPVLEPILALYRVGAPKLRQWRSVVVHKGGYSRRQVPEFRRLMMDILRIVIAILLPPLGVFLQVGIGKHFWINILLTILGYIPGIIHAVWVIAKY